MQANGRLGSRNTVIRYASHGPQPSTHTYAHAANPTNNVHFPLMLQCRPKDCRDVVDGCTACSHRRPFKCTACEFGYKVVDNEVGCAARYKFCTHGGLAAGYALATQQGTRVQLARLYQHSMLLLCSSLLFYQAVGGALKPCSSLPPPCPCHAVRLFATCPTYLAHIK